MAPRGKSWSRVGAMSGLVAAAAVVWCIGAGPAMVSGAAQGQSTFSGGNPSRMPSDKLSTLRLMFPKGSRSNWHSHSWGQLLMVEEGKGLTQERNGPVREMGPANRGSRKPVSNTGMAPLPTSTWCS